MKLREGLVLGFLAGAAIAQFDDRDWAGAWFAVGLFVLCLIISAATAGARIDARNRK